MTKYISLTKLMTPKVITINNELLEHANWLLPSLGAQRTKNVIVKVK